MWKSLTLAFCLWSALTPAVTAGVQPPASASRVIDGKRIPYWITRIDLNDPHVIPHLAFAGGRKHPAGTGEGFASLAARAGGAVAVNGTFFNLKTFDTFGNLVAAGRLVQFREWDDRGTALIIGRDKRARLQTIRVSGWPAYHDAWLVLPAGPRLVKAGKPRLIARKEGFRDPVLFGRKPRTAIGITDAGKTLCLVTIRADISLDEEARLMAMLGFDEALNLDGGTSVGLAVNGTSRLLPRTPITQALVFYDAQHPAPRDLSSRFVTWSTQPAGPPLTLNPPPHR